MKQNVVKIFAAALMVGFSAVVGGFVAYKVSNNQLSQNKTATAYYDDEFSKEFKTGNGLTLVNNPSDQSGLVDLTYAAELSVHAVVHIKSTEHSKTRYVEEAPDIFDLFFGYGGRRQRQIETEPKVGMGSGVIISSDGYIVTNNHVIEGADEIDVTLNDKREYKAILVGTDPTTDVALLKIEEKDLPFLTLSNSDNIKVGEWVLAVGNPFNLSSTVTAGIVSAKARNLNIYSGTNGSIESFIQTDAAINRGNSGGALVNAKGELVGINAAIFAPTGVYSGYGFAIPTNLVKAVVVDLKKYGTVQRAQLGILGGDNNAELAKEKNLGINTGVFVSKTVDGGAAQKAGIKENDVIVGIDDKPINSMGELQEIIARTKPGTTVKVKIYRDGKEKVLSAVLGINEEVSGIASDSKSEVVLGAEFESIDKNAQKRLGISGGLEVKKISNGKFRNSGIQEGYIIMKVNNKSISSVSDLEKVIKEASSSEEKVLYISGVYPSGRRAFYAIDLR